MIIYIVLILVVEQFQVICGNQLPEANENIKDGLVLSYFLSFRDISRIDNYVASKGFMVYKDGVEKEGNYSYFKYLDEKQRDIMFINIQNHKAVSISPPTGASL